MSNVSLPSQWQDFISLSVDFFFFLFLIAYLSNGMLEMCVELCVCIHTSIFMK